MANQKERVEGIGELSTKGRSLYVVLRRAGGFDENGVQRIKDVEIPLDHALTSAEREQIDDMWPDPLPPRETNPVSGLPFRDDTDEGWRRDIGTLTVKRRDARVVRMLGASQLGVAEVQTKAGIEKGIEVLRNIEGITPADIMSIDAQGRAPNEVTEEGVARKEQELSPGTPAPPSV